MAITLWCRSRPDLAERNRQRAVHGLSDSPIHVRWRSMIRRCHDPKVKDYPRYGGVGITVCSRWRESVLNFLADMGYPPVGMTLDRRDNTKGYSPENCRWVPCGAQNRNQRTNVMVEYDGLRLCVAEWAERIGLERKTLEYRIRVGWEVERALITPSLINRKAA